MRFSVVFTRARSVLSGHAGKANVKTIVGIQERLCTCFLPAGVRGKCEVKSHHVGGSGVVMTTAATNHPEVTQREITLHPIRFSRVWGGMMPHAFPPFRTPTLQCENPLLIFLFIFSFLPLYVYLFSTFFLLLFWYTFLWVEEFGGVVVVWYLQLTETIWVSLCPVDRQSVDKQKPHKINDGTAAEKVLHTVCVYIFPFFNFYQKKNVPLTFIFLSFSIFSETKIKTDKNKHTVWWSIFHVIISYHVEERNGGVKWTPENEVAA